MSHYVQLSVFFIWLVAQPDMLEPSESGCWSGILIIPSKKKNIKKKEKPTQSVAFVTLALGNE
jgi:hypothetical protein